MTSVHALAAMAALAVAAVLAVAAGIAAWRDLAHELIRIAALGAVATFGLAALLGMAAMVSGPAPREWLHIVYAGALLGVVPLGLVFASDAPARARSGVLAVAAVVALLAIWRLFATA